MKFEPIASGLFSRRGAVICPVIGWLALLLFIAGISSVPAEAQEISPELGTEEPVETAAEEEDDDWDVSLGIIGGFGPKFEGSDEYDFFWSPKGKIAWRDTLILTESSFRVQFRQGRFRFGPKIKYEKGRSDDDDNDIKGVGDVDAGFSAGAFVKYKLDGYALTAEARQEFAGGHGGFIGELGGEVLLPDAESPWGKLRAELAMVDDRYMDEFFGVNARQSANSGLQTYDPDGGLKSISLAWQSAYEVWRGLSLGGRIQYVRLLDQAADSPIVDVGSPNGAAVAIGLSYRF
jgi:outer membrane scaffolding protein for murein synthesis (MipA/OmpV family)